MKTWKDRGIPNPGSDDAIKRGCTCPVMDNNHGKWSPWPPYGWWMNGECPLHVMHKEPAK